MEHQRNEKLLAVAVFYYAERGKYTFRKGNCALKCSSPFSLEVTIKGKNLLHDGANSFL